MWAILDEDWRATHDDTLRRGLEELGLQVEVEDAEGYAHLSTKLKRLGRGHGFLGVVLHGSSTGRVIAVCVVVEDRREVKRRVFQVRAMAVR